MKLIIVESPAKAKTIGKIMGKEFNVMASKGHIRDLPKDTLAIDVNNNYKPRYEISQDREAIINSLVSAAKKSDEIFLAPDPDREGEAIAWHLKEVLSEKLENKELPFRRVQYNEITPSAVRKAFAAPGEINMPRVDAQQARRLLDRIVGYKISPFLGKRLGSSNLSAGRVQTVALRLVCERDAEIAAFIPTPYWIFSGMFSKLVEPKTPFKATLKSINGKKADIKDEAFQQQIQNDLNACKYKLVDLKTTTEKKSTKPPFKTSTLQQAASNAFGFSPSATMQIAQKLYEGVELKDEGTVGLITYMRTDSVAVSNDARDAAHRYITQTYGEQYFNGKNFTNSKNAQAAHECIRPTDPMRTPEHVKGVLSERDLKLYSLIWTRFIASQMTDVVYEQLTAYIDTESSCQNVYTFSASARKLIFDGFTKLIKEKPRKQESENDDGEEEFLDGLPPLEIGEYLAPFGTPPKSERKENKPPYRFNEASLIQELERNGIGRPSTYATIIKTLNDRRYVEKDGKAMHATQLGVDVNNVLIKYFPELFNVKFTASMEEELDRIEESHAEWTSMIDQFFKKLEEWLAQARGAVDPEVVKSVLALMANIVNWAKPIRTGRNSFSEQRFLKDIQACLDPAASEADQKRSRSVTERQFKTLIDIAYRYKNEIPDLESKLGEIGVEYKPEQPVAPDEKVLKLFEVMDNSGIPDEKDKAFVESLKKWVEGGRALTTKQQYRLQMIFNAMHENVTNFSPELCTDLGVEYKPVEKVDTSRIEDLLTALSKVANWRQPSKRGKRVFNDYDFYTSVQQQFSNNKVLSDRQLYCLDRMVVTYKDQIDNFAELAKKYDLKDETPKSRYVSKAKSESTPNGDEILPPPEQKN
ncbi:MAG: type I DNA topoisomerase [Kiritimatiellae bacterium]|nr:type I DNA topoisomerase [Kiritimatiellia bacterium]